MDRLRRAGLLTRLIEGLRNNGSWCGETHVQKATFLAQELAGIPLGFDFILYKHGPFSFDLRDELTALRADGLLKLETQWPYGPRISPTPQSEYIEGLYPRTLEKYGTAVAFVTNRLSNKGVSELERLATAFYVNLREDKTSVDERATRLTELKPHISKKDARDAIQAIDKIAEDAEAQFSLLTEFDD